jgi:UDP-glucose 4-epimerase
MPTTCLVTGGAGFIGSHIATHLVGAGHAVRVVDNLSTGSRDNLRHLEGRIDFIEGDLCDASIAERATRDIELVFHLAALPSVPRSLAEPWRSHDANVNATVRLLEACRAAKVRRVVYSSSSSVYGDTPVLPKCENVECLPRSPYAASKLASEQYVLAYARAGLVEGTALRYFNIFGPRQSARSAYAAIIPICCDACRTGKPVRLFGDGRQTRDFTYVENAVHANMLAATAPAACASGAVVNTGAGQRTSLLELLDLIGDVTGTPLDYVSTAPRAGDVRDSLASLERAHQILGYEPQVDIHEGLRRTWEWFSSLPAVDENAGLPSTMPTARC